MRWFTTFLLGEDSWVHVGSHNSPLFLRDEDTWRDCIRQEEKLKENLFVHSAIISDELFVFEKTSEA